MGIVLRNHAHAGQTLQHTRLLVTVHGAELEETQRQLTVRTPTRTVNLVMHGAVHGLQTIVAVVELHRREHTVRVVRQVPGRVEQVFLRDMRGAHVLETLSNMAGAHIIFHLALNHATLRVNHRQAGANILREREQVKLLAQAAVVAAFSLSNTVLILHQLILRGPGGTVNTLKHGVLLRTAPIRATGTHERVPVSNQFSIRQVRAAAQVIPQHLTGFRVHIVINRNLARTNLNRGALGGISTRTGALTERKQLELIRLVLHLFNRFIVGDHAAAEQLP